MALLGLVTWNVATLSGIVVSSIGGSSFFSYIDIVDSLHGIASGVDRTNGLNSSNSSSSIHASIDNSALRLHSRLRRDDLKILRLHLADVLNDVRVHDDVWDGLVVALLTGLVALGLTDCTDCTDRGTDRTDRNRADVDLARVDLMVCLRGSADVLDHDVVSDKLKLTVVF